MNPLDNSRTSVRPTSEATAFFSSSDTEAYVSLPFITDESFTASLLKGLVLVSLSTHRDVFPVVSNGRRGIKGFTTGHRTSAGSLGFILEGSDPFAELIRVYTKWINRPDLADYILPDELPPFDLLLLNTNLYNHSSSVLVKSVKIIDSSKNISLRDIQLSENYSFICANVFPITDGTLQGKMSNQAVVTNGTTALTNTLQGKAQTIVNSIPGWLQAAAGPSTTSTSNVPPHDSIQN